MKRRMIYIDRKGRWEFWGNWVTMVVGHLIQSTPKAFRSSNPQHELHVLEQCAVRALDYDTVMHLHEWASENSRDRDYCCLIELLWTMRDKQVRDTLAWCPTVQDFVVQMLEGDKSDTLFGMARGEWTCLHQREEWENRAEARAKAENHAEACAKEEGV